VESVLYPTGNLSIPVSHGKLEAIFKEPDNNLSLKGVALVLHPHPLHGGTMHNKVVYRAARALNDAGFATLRINFRGVGQSTGTHGYGQGEMEDIQTALDYITEHHADNPILLAGFSFGARFGLEVGVSDPRVSRLIGIGTPVNMYEFDFLNECKKPLLLVHGDQDQFGDVSKLQTIAAQIPKEANVEIKIIKGAEHFFEGHLEEMMEAITKWAKND
jgi:uncharacterized protein